MYAYLIFVEFDLKFKNLQKPLQKLEAYRKIFANSWNSC